MNASIDELYLDGSYDSFQNHADIWYRLGVKPMISLPKDAVINRGGKVRRLDHWVNKMWELGGSKDMNIDAKLKFLYKMGGQEQVGTYFRNRNLANELFPDSCKFRSECERIHRHIKGTVKLDVRNVRDGSRELYTKFSFVTYQLLALASLKNRIKPVNSFENYI